MSFITIYDPVGSSEHNCWDKLPPEEDIVNRVVIQCVECGQRYIGHAFTARWGEKEETRYWLEATKKQVEEHRRNW